MSIKIDNMLCRHWCKFPIKNWGFTPNYILDGSHYLLDVKDTIHYRTLLVQKYDVYNNLINTTSQKEHSEARFKHLQGKFKVESMGKIKIRYNSKYKKYIIIDGVHRLCVLLWKGIDSISVDHLDIEYDSSAINRIQQVLKKTTEKGHYNNWANTNKFDCGYHSFVIGKRTLKGQRYPVKRLNILKKHIDFDNKKVVDFGCNTGGMLLHLPEINKGIGFDYDDKCITAAKEIRDIFKYNNDLRFMIHDFDRDPNEILSKNIDFKPDYIFILSLGSWIKKWRKLYTYSSNLGGIIVLETNNDAEGKPQLDLFRNMGFNIELISAKSTDDITGNYNRKLYLIK